MKVLIITAIVIVVSGQPPYYKPTDYVPYQLLDDYNRPHYSAPSYKPEYPSLANTADYEGPAAHKPASPEKTYKPYQHVPDIKPVSSAYPTFVQAHSVKY